MRASEMTKLILLLSIVTMASLPPMAFSLDGDSESGERIYLKRCVGCHGVDGDGLGPGSERLIPPPRDFTSGMFKIMSTAFDGYIPQDQDIYEMIRIGMPGTAMPGWEDILSEQNMWDLVAYIKIFPGFDEEQAGPAVEYGEPIPSSAESIEKGRELFLQDDRCSECHGKDGKGDAIKRLLGDNGERTWPRNLTKPWTFRHSNDQKDIFTRISVGIPGTQMPSFADPGSKKMLSVEDRWHVVNYVKSLAKTVRVVNAENTVIKSLRVEGSVPAEVDDEIWEQAIPSSFFLVPQIIVKDRHFTPSNDTVTVRSVFSADEIAILLEWDDRTKSLPGDEDAQKIADPEVLHQDMVSIQLPITVPEGMEKPYFVKGDTENPVNLWQWASGTTTEPQSTSLVKAAGFGTETELATDSLKASGAYESGTWRVVFRRSLSTESSDDLQIQEGIFIPIAFSAWDGSNGESGTKKTLTTWYWITLESESTALPFIGALIALFLVIGLEMLWLRNGAGRRNPST